jgi:hypothetical protein
LCERAAERRIGKDGTDVVRAPQRIVAIRRALRFEYAQPVGDAVEQGLTATDLREGRRVHAQRKREDGDQNDD